MSNALARATTIATALVLGAACAALAGCASGYGPPPPSVLNEPPPNLAARCHLASRDVMVRSAMPELRRACGAWSDPQTAVTGF
jgi:hypothetical protein